MGKNKEEGLVKLSLILCVIGLLMLLLTPMFKTWARIDSSDILTNNLGISKSPKNSTNKLANGVKNTEIRFVSLPTNEAVFTEVIAKHDLPPIPAPNSVHRIPIVIRSGFVVTTNYTVTNWLDGTNMMFRYFPNGRTYSFPTNQVEILPPEKRNDWLK